MLAGFVEPGVYDLNQMDRTGMRKAAIVCPMDRVYYIDAFKEFYSFMEDVDVIQTHLSISQVYLRLTQHDEMIEMSMDERNAYYCLLEFLAKVATGKMWFLKEERIMLRNLIKSRNAEN